MAVCATICDIENCDLIFLLHTKALNHGDSFIQRLLFDMLQFVLLLKVMKKPHYDSQKVIHRGANVPA